MNHKNILTFILSMIFLIGVVNAANTISNIEGITIPANTIAGNNFIANFSFDYLDFPSNDDESALIIKLNLSSSNQTNYPVWKNDFEIDGYVEKYFFGINVKTINFDCSESEPTILENEIGQIIIEEVPNGTFYCYDEEANLNVDEHDEVFLNIKSHPALWPGSYNLTAEMFYLNDTIAPRINITNKNDFTTKYYRENDYIEAQATIQEANLANKWGKVFLTNSTFTIPFTNKIGETYYFSTNTPSNIQEGNYPLYIFADDENGNLENDSTILRIDRTGPVLDLLQPDGSVYVDTIPIEINITDEKAGVDESSARYRISEIVGGTFCPTTGIIFGNFSCYQSGWISIEYNETTNTYTDLFNSTELHSGEYLFEAEAKDILGNQGILE